MRELSMDEQDLVSGGNLTLLAYESLQVVGAFGTGYAFGSAINSFNENVTGMSFGEAIYYTVN